MALRRWPALDLALQGGGSHGAFTWGVLDRLLDEPGLRLDGVSGTSAGALNAAVLASGWAGGGAVGAQAALRAFWQDVGGAHGCFGAAPLPLAAYNLDANPFFAATMQWLKLFSPYQLDPFGGNALEAVLRRHVDLEALQQGPLKVFVAATSVQTGQPRIFSGATLSLPALLASACLPQLFKAVEVDGEPYWDGGYSGNPALWPLIYETAAKDLLLVKINPLVRRGTPTTAAEIADRVNEITFNAGLVAEMRAIDFVRRLLAEQRLDPRRYKGLRLHMVADEAGLAPLHPSSKLNTAPGFLQALHGLGRTAAGRWIAAHRGDLGRRSSLDIAADFLAPRHD